MARGLSIVPDLLPLAVPVDQVKPMPGNARDHDLDDLKQSLRDNGQYRPITANRRTGHIVKGNGTYQAALALGATRIAVTWIDVDEKDEKRTTVVDNRTAELGWMNDALLHEALTSMEDLSGTGYAQDDLAWLERTLQGPVVLPPAPEDTGAAIKDAKQAYDESPVSQLVLVVSADEHGPLLADLDALALPEETVASVVVRLVREALGDR